MLQRITSWVIIVALVFGMGFYNTAKDNVVKASDLEPTSLDWKLEWCDDFNGESLDKNNWTYDIGKGPAGDGWGNRERQYYTDREDNVKVSNGNLKLIAKRESYGRSSYTSGRIHTKDKQSFKYGKMEARIKVDNGNHPGIWPAFWMMGTDYDSVGWPKCGELDIMEHRNEESRICGYMHCGETWDTVANFGKNYEFADNENEGITAWHTYGITWDENYVNWYVDGQVYYSKKMGNFEKHYFQKEYYFLLDLAVGGKFTYDSVPKTDFEYSVMYVDYVRAFSYGEEAPTVTTIQSQTDEPTTPESTVEPTTEEQTEEPTVQPITQESTTEYDNPTSESTTQEITTETTTQSPTTTTEPYIEETTTNYYDNWTDVPNNDMTPISNGLWNLFAYYDESNGAKAKLAYRYNVDNPTRIGDTDVLIKSSTGYDSSYSFMIANNALDGLVQGKSYSVSLEYYTNQNSGVDERGNDRVLTMLFSKKNYSFPLEACENGRTKIVTVDSSFSYEGTGDKDVSFMLDYLKTGTIISIKNIIFDEIKDGWNPIDNNKEVAINDKLNLYACYDSVVTGMWGKLSYKKNIEDPTEIGDVDIKVRSSSGWFDAWGTVATLKQATSNLERGKTYKVSVEYYSSENSGNDPNGNPRQIRMQIDGYDFDFSYDQCAENETKTYTFDESFKFDGNSFEDSKDILINLDRVAPGTILSIKEVKFVEVGEQQMNRKSKGSYMEVDFDDDDYFDVGEYKINNTYPTKEGYIFAGWFEDEAYTTPYMETTGYAYAKFIDEDALTFKFQKANDGSAIRFVSSIDDYLDYQTVGFKFTGTYGNAVITEKTKTTNSLYTKITAAGESILPSVFSNDSAYFFTYTVRGLDADTDSTWTVKPFIKTADGTEVTGKEGHYPNE
ncbi:MAG: family 16 glycosylhydrolase [Eubacterium sp.]|nr:family 16 glycosylhydrolase [Eubacterium sp.]